MNAGVGFNNVLSVSLGICAYNEEKNIRLLLESILRQKTGHIIVEEIIVISDGSTDKTNAILEDFSFGDKLRVIKLDKRYGKYIAVNKFIKTAKYRVLLLASADIILDAGAIESLCLPL
jgi:glycosyltransferase involved in cell wall biosynthesis